jgi:DNA-binding transcriptional LysR family regulator
LRHCRKGQRSHDIWGDTCSARNLLCRNLRIQLVPVPRSFSLSEREADLAIMVGRPEKGRLRARKLVDYALRLYAFKDYLDRVGRPEELADLERHSLVGDVDDLI